MFLKIIGYFFAAAGVMGIAFFKLYRSTEIPYPILWFFVSMVIVIAGIALVVKAKLNDDKKYNKYRWED